jgi:hypothetical protein
MLMGWIGLSVALFGGLGNMYGWERFYMSYRDYEWHQHDGKPKRKVITFWRRVAFAAQVLGFIIGVAGIAWFAATNLPYAKAGGT